MNDGRNDRETPRVAVVLEGIIPSTYIRIFSPFVWLSEKRLARFRVLSEAEITAGRLQDFDVVVVQRATSELAIEVLSAAQNAGVPLVYECDDNFLAIHEDVPVVGSHYTDPFVRERFTQMLRGADVVTTSTEVLEAAFSEFNRDVRTLPNCVDLEYLDPRPRKAAADRTVIGYAGTVTHSPDFAVVEPVLEQLLDESAGSIELQFFGYVPERFKGRQGVSHVDYDPDYASFMRVLSQVDWSLGIAPLADLPFNHGKTNNKYREYGACRLPGVYSDCGVYNSSVRNRVTGLLVEHSESGWYAGLRAMIDHPRLQGSIAHNAYDAVTAAYSVEGAASAWLSVFTGPVSVR